ncbi:MAG TPA: hypothetical protein V6D48_19955 [Oculatellaceae cyanobacterium]
MSLEPTDSNKEELKQLWGGGKVPPLTVEETDLSLKLWQKIQKRKQREQQHNTSPQIGTTDQDDFRL